MQPQNLDRKVWGKIYRYRLPSLKQTITMQEAVVIFEVPQYTLYRDFRYGDIEGRRAITGHGILLDYDSLVQKYGQPKYNPLADLQEKDN